MNIYIITTGDYSDYHIVAAFTNKAKAKAYVKANTTGKWSDHYRLESYECMDDDIITSHWFVRYNYNGISEPTISIEQTSEGDLAFTPEDGDFYREDYEYDDEFNQFETREFCGNRIIHANSIVEGIIKAKYTKHCYDQMAFCKQLEVEGMTIKDINIALSKHEPDDFIPN